MAAIVSLAVWSAPALAAVDGSAPMLCALTSVVECSEKGDCARSGAEAADVPPFIRINVAQRLLSSTDGRRTSPIASVRRVNGRLMLQGAQNGRVWGAVIDEQTGRMAATIGEHDGAFVLSGAGMVP